MSVYPARLGQTRSAKYEIEIAASVAAISMRDRASYHRNAVTAKRSATTRSEIVCWVIFPAGTERSRVRQHRERRDFIMD
jgi:hypothetical protein